MKQKLAHLLNEHPTTALCGKKNQKDVAKVVLPVYPKCFELFCKMLEKKIEHDLSRADISNYRQRRIDDYVYFSKEKFPGVALDDKKMDFIRELAIADERNYLAFTAESKHRVKLFTEVFRLWKGKP